MKTKSGILEFGKREEKAMLCVLSHCKRDMSYGGGGSFTKGDNNNTEDSKEIKMAQQGIELFEWIINTFKK